MRTTGLSFAFEKGGFSRTRCECNDAAHEMTIAAVAGSRLVRKQLVVRLAGDPRGRTVVFSGKTLRLRFQ